MVQKDGGLEPGQIEPRAQPLAAAEGGEAAAAHDHVGPLFPPPGVEGVRVVMDGGVEVDGAEVNEDAPALGDEVSPHLHVPHRLPHDPVYDVAHPQRLRDHLNHCAWVRRWQSIVNFVGKIKQCMLRCMSMFLGAEK